MKTKTFINITTGEIVYTTNKLNAFYIFNNKRLHGERFKHIMNIEKYYKLVKKHKLERYY